MSCAHHPKAEVEAVCASCGKDMCQECLEKSVVRNNNAVCADCAPQALKDNITQSRKARTAAMNAIIIAAPLMLFGLFSAFTGVGRGGEATASNKLLTIVFYFGLAALPSVWNAIAMRGPQEGLILQGKAGQILRIISQLSLGYLLGIALAPLSVIRNLQLRKELEAQIKSCESLLKNYKKKSRSK